MRRLSRNRWWSYVLALGICVACFAALAATARAELYPEPGSPPPVGTGDPDVTGGTGRSPGKGAIVRGGGSLTHGAGDIGRSGYVSVGRLYYVTLLGLRRFYLNF